MTPDPYQAAGGPSDPQSWNQYAYTRGDPVNRYDPGGLDDCDPNDPENPCLPGGTITTGGGRGNNPDKGGPRTCGPGLVLDSHGHCVPPFSECDRGSTAEDKNLSFIVQNYAAANQLSTTYGVPADWILGWAAQESGYGHGDSQAQLQDNFYNEILPPGGVTGGWAGAVPCPAKAAPGWACFDSFYGSANGALNKVSAFMSVFMQSNPGASMAQVFQAMNNKFTFDTGSDAAQYGQEIQNTTQGGLGLKNSLDQRIHCLLNEGDIP